MTQGKRHYDVTGFVGWDALFAVLCPERWWLRIMAVRMLRQLKMVPPQSVVGMLFWPASVDDDTSFEQWAEAIEVPLGELTFKYRGTVWEVFTVQGHVRPYIPKDVTVVV